MIYIQFCVELKDIFDNQTSAFFQEDTNMNKICI